MTGFLSRAAAFATIVAVVVGVNVGSRADVTVGDHPGFGFRSTAGRTISSRALRGKIVIVDFWATWCGPCMHEMPHMLEINKKYGSRGVQIIGISLDSSRQALAKVVKARNIPWPQYFDGLGWDNRYARQWGVHSIPHTYILSPQGEVLWVGHPANLDKALAEAIKAHPPVKAGHVAAQADRQAIQAAVKALDAARQAVNKGDFKEMLAHTSKVEESAMDDATVQRSLRVLANKLRIQAKDSRALAQARQADPAGTEHLAKLMMSLRPDDATQAVADKPTAGNATPAKADASDETTGVGAETTANGQARGAGIENAGYKATAARVIQTKLKKATRDDAAKQYLNAYKGYKWLTEHAQGMPAASEAARQIAQYQADKDVMAKIKMEQAEENARALLAMAHSYELADRQDLARKQYEKVVKEYPKTKCCDQAKKKLAKGG